MWQTWKSFLTLVPSSKWIKLENTTQTQLWKPERSRLQYFRNLHEVPDGCTRDKGTKANSILMTRLFRKAPFSLAPRTKFRQNRGEYSTSRRSFCSRSFPLSFPGNAIHLGNFAFVSGLVTLFSCTWRNCSKAENCAKCKSGKISDGRSPWAINITFTLYLQRAWKVCHKFRSFEWVPKLGSVATLFVFNVQKCEHVTGLVTCCEDTVHNRDWRSETSFGGISKRFPPSLQEISLWNEQRELKTQSVLATRRWL